MNNWIEYTALTIWVVAGIVGSFTIYKLLMIGML